ncbi:BrnT family toxin [Candidatus Magnetobacterium casense]|uniref:BrnT family toxin n=1 Tax=Candidatus Magnetobacterium casense TaxID=1455061 RepID=UPI0013DE3BD8
MDEVIDKLLRKHNVRTNEVAEVLLNKPHFRFVEKGYRISESVYSAMGQTSDGRYLIVFFIYKKGGSVLVVSARDMTSSERKRYEQI